MIRVLTHMPQVMNRVRAETTQVDEGGETTRLGGETTQVEDDVGGTTWAVSGEMNHEHVGAQVEGERTLEGDWFRLERRYVPLFMSAVAC